MASCSHSNPRKFSEKIALHRQKEAEEKAEYDKIMSECAMVKGGTGRVPASVSHVHPPPPAYNAMGPDVASRLLPPNISNSVNRHGSLPNVNSAIQSLDHSGTLESGGIPLILGDTHHGPLNPHPHHHLQHSHQQHQQQHSLHHHNFHSHQAGPQNGSLSHHHVSLREQQTGPIRSVKNRIDTSPYGSSYHLLPPGNPVDWRRTVSDSSLHQSVHGSHENVSKHHQGPSHQSSPHKKSLMDDGSNRFSISSSQKQSTQNFSGYLLPNDPSDKKPGSLPDLSTFASSSLNDRSNGGGGVCSSNENSPPGLSNESPVLPGASSNPSHLTQNPTSPDLSTSSWSPNHRQSDGGGGVDYGRNPSNNSQLSYSSAQVSSPIAYGGRCTSPIDVVSGSPHSPLGHPMSPTSPSLNSSLPNNNNTSYEDLEAYSQEQVELNREFQRFTMMDTWDNSAQYSQNYYFRGNPSRYEQNENQPMNELVNFLTSMDSKGNHPTSPSCAQTPSGIPEIILTDDAGTDQDLHGFAMSTALECVNEDSLKADLGKLDDSMLLLLTESGGSDQAIADPMTEEHLKLI